MSGRFRKNYSHVTTLKQTVFLTYSTYAYTCVDSKKYHRLWIHTDMAHRYFAWSFMLFRAAIAGFILFSFPTMVYTMYDILFWASMTRVLISFAGMLFSKCVILIVSSTGIADSGAYYSTNWKHDILLDDVECTGDEQSLMDCRHKGWGEHNCNANQDVGLRCCKCIYSSVIHVRRIQYEHKLPYILVGPIGVWGQCEICTIMVWSE